MSDVRCPLAVVPNGKHFTPSCQKRVREEKPFHRATGTESLALNWLAGQKCCALLIKSNVIQFHYTRPEMCALHIYISRLARSLLRPSLSFTPSDTFGRVSCSIFQDIPGYSRTAGLRLGFVICICFISLPAAHFECGALAKWQQK